jgi:hypothetical protein
LPEISELNRVLMEVEWDKIFRGTKFETIVPVYLKRDVLSLQAFLREKFNRWAGNGSCIVA